MMTVGSFSRDYASITLLCALAATASAPSTAATVSRILEFTDTPPTSVTNPNLYSFQPVVHDSAVSWVGFQVFNKPAWAQFNIHTGLLNGRPNAHQVGQYKNVQIRALDRYGYKDLFFTIAVLPAPVNNPPSISGHPAASIPVGMEYTFTPAAADPEHHALTFSIENKPSWAQFNTASGSLTGMPAAADVGSYANVRISVSDGNTSAALPTFSVTVNQIATSNVTLDWTPPTENSDGSVLTDLAGYQIHYGLSKDNLTQTAKITNPGLTSYVVDQLPAGTWYFDVAAYSKSGLESVASAIVSTVVQ